MSDLQSAVAARHGASAVLVADFESAQDHQERNRDFFLATWLWRCLFVTSRRPPTHSWPGHKAESAKACGSCLVRLSRGLAIGPAGRVPLWLLGAGSAGRLLEALEAGAQESAGAEMRETGDGPSRDKESRSRSKSKWGSRPLLS